jgi:hypothetical protein
MVWSSRLEKPADKEEGAENRSVAKATSPPSRFKELARRLVNVPREEFLAKQEEYKDRKT